MTRCSLSELRVRLREFLCLSYCAQLMFYVTNDIQKISIHSRSKREKVCLGVVYEETIFKCSL